MAGVVTALIAHDDVEALGEQIDDLAFALIAPLGADDCDNHETTEVRDQKSDLRKTQFQISNSKFKFGIADPKPDTKQARLVLGTNKAAPEGLSITQRWRC